VGVYQPILSAYNNDSQPAKMTAAKMADRAPGLPKWQPQQISYQKSAEQILCHKIFFSQFFFGLTFKIRSVKYRYKKAKEKENA